MDCIIRLKEFIDSYKHYL